MMIAYYTEVIALVKAMSLIYIYILKLELQLG